MGIARGQNVMRDGGPLAVAGMKPAGVAAKGNLVYRGVVASWNFFGDTSLAGTIYNGAYTLGFRFSSTIAGAVIQHRIYLIPPSTVANLSIWRVSDSSRISTITPTLSGTGWMTIALPSPVAIAASSLYWVTLFSGGGSYAQVDGSAPRISGPLTLDTFGYAAGDTISGMTVIADTWFFNDIVFREGS